MKVAIAIQDYDKQRANYQFNNWKLKFVPKELIPEFQQYIDAHKIIFYSFDGQQFATLEEAAT